MGSHGVVWGPTGMGWGPTRWGGVPRGRVRSQGAGWGLTGSCGVHGRGLEACPRADPNLVSHAASFADPEATNIGIGRLHGGDASMSFSMAVKSRCRDGIRARAPQGPAAVILPRSRRVRGARVRSPFTLCRVDPGIVRAGVTLGSGLLGQLETDEEEDEAHRVPAAYGKYEYGMGTCRIR